MYAGRGAFAPILQVMNVRSAEAADIAAGKLCLPDLRGRREDREMLGQLAVYHEHRPGGPAVVMELYPLFLGPRQQPDFDDRGAV